MRIWWRKWI